MECFEQKPTPLQARAMSERTKQLQKLGIGEVSKKGINLFKIDTFQTSGLTSDIEKLEKTATINSVTYSKNTGISLWVKLK